MATAITDEDEEVLLAFALADAITDSTEITAEIEPNLSSSTVTMHNGTETIIDNNNVSSSSVISARATDNNLPNSPVPKSSIVPNPPKAITLSEAIRMKNGPSSDLIRSILQIDKPKSSASSSQLPGGPSANPRFQQLLSSSSIPSSSSSSSLYSSVATSLSSKASVPNRSQASTSSYTSSVPFTKSTTSSSSLSSSLSVKDSSSSSSIEMFSGLHIRQREITSDEVQEALQNRTVYRISTLSKGTQKDFDNAYDTSLSMFSKTPFNNPSSSGGNPTGNIKRRLPVAWVTIGVLVQVSHPFVSQHNSNNSSSSSSSTSTQRNGVYKIWTLTDFHSSIQLFLGGEAYHEYANETVGGIFLISSPTLVPATQKQSFSLSVSYRNQLVKLGESPDYGICKGKRKDGNPCTMYVNIRECPYCHYHVNDVYKKAVSNYGAFIDSGGMIAKNTLHGIKNISEGHYGSEATKHIDHLAASTAKYTNSNVNPHKEKYKHPGIGYGSSNAYGYDNDGYGFTGSQPLTVNSNPLLSTTASSIKLPSNSVSQSKMITSSLVISNTGTVTEHRERVPVKSNSSSSMFSKTGENDSKSFGNQHPSKGVHTMVVSDEHTRQKIAQAIQENENKKLAIGSKLPLSHGARLATALLGSSNNGSTLNSNIPPPKNILPPQTKLPSDVRSSNVPNRSITGGSTKSSLPPLSVPLSSVPKSALPPPSSLSATDKITEKLQKVTTQRINGNTLVNHQNKMNENLKRLREDDLSLEQQVLLLKQQNKILKQQLQGQSSSSPLSDYTTSRANSFTQGHIDTNRGPPPSSQDVKAMYLLSKAQKINPIVSISNQTIKPVNPLGTIFGIHEEMDNETSINFSSSVRSRPASQHSIKNNAIVMENTESSFDKANALRQVSQKYREQTTPPTVRGSTSVVIPSNVSSSDAIVSTASHIVLSDDDEESSSDELDIVPTAPMHEETIIENSMDEVVPTLSTATVDGISDEYQNDDINYEELEEILALSEQLKAIEEAKNAAVLDNDDSRTNKVEEIDHETEASPSVTNTADPFVSTVNDTNETSYQFGVDDITTAISGNGKNTYNPSMLSTSNNDSELSIFYTTVPLSDTVPENTAPSTTETTVASYSYPPQDIPSTASIHGLLPSFTGHTPTGKRPPPIRSTNQQPLKLNSSSVGILSRPLFNQTSISSIEPNHLSTPVTPILSSHSSNTSILPSGTASRLIASVLGKYSLPPPSASTPSTSISTGLPLETPPNPVTHGNQRRIIDPLSVTKTVQSSQQPRLLPNPSGTNMYSIPNLGKITKTIVVSSTNPLPSTKSSVGMNRKGLSNPHGGSTFVSSSSSSASAKQPSLTLEGLQNLLSQRSIFEEEANAKVMDTIMERMDHREKLEHMEEKLKEQTSMKITRWFCEECNRHYDASPSACYTEGHSVTTQQVMKYAFRCSHCRYRVWSTTASCAVACNKCGKHGPWESVSIYASVKDGSNDPGLVPKAQARGEEQINSLRYGK